MLIQKHQKPKFIIREIKKKGAITNADSTEHEEFRLSWVFVLANQLTTLTPELLEKPSLNIIVAGAEQESEAPSVYQLLNSLLGTKIDFTIRLIGTDAHIDPFNRIKLNTPYHDHTVSVEVHRSSLGAELERGGLPDLISLNSPGLESHPSLPGYSLRMSWEGNGQGA